MLGITLLTTVRGLRHTLLDYFPESFGGMYCTNGSTAYAIQIANAKDRDAIEAYVEAELQAVTPEWRDFISVEFAETNLPLSVLFSLKDRLWADRNEWSTRGLPIQGVGLNDMINKVIVSVPLDAPEPRRYIATLRDAYEQDAFEVVKADPPRLLVGR